MMCYSDLRANKLMAGRLSEWLGQHDMPVLEFSRRAGVNQSTMYNLTSGKRSTSVAVFRRICKAGKIDANWLLGLK